MEDIKSLPVGRLAARDSVLFLWTTGPFLRHAVEVVEAWGFTHKTVGFNWVKTNARDGNLRMGVGFQTRANTEICLLATRGRGLHRVRNDINQVVVAPIGGHSEKPEEVRRRIEALYGPQRWIELFARKRAEGWDAVGNEIDGSDIRKVLAGA
jgi:N6-adenosine-specific RNA methylase IME4